MLKLHNPHDVPGFIKALGELLHAATAAVVPTAPSSQFYEKILELNLCRNFPDAPIVVPQNYHDLSTQEKADLNEATKEQDPVPPIEREIDVEALPPKLAAIYKETQQGSTKKFCTKCGMPLQGGVCQECLIPE